MLHSLGMIGFGVFGVFYLLGKIETRMRQAGPGRQPKSRALEYDSSGESLILDTAVTLWALDELEEMFDGNEE